MFATSLRFSSRAHLPRPNFDVAYSLTADVIAGGE